MKGRRIRPLQRAVFHVGIVLPPALLLIGFVMFVTGMPQKPEHLFDDADAIVILTGGSERFPAGVALLASGAADHLFVTGVPSGIDTETLLHAHGLDGQNLPCCIELGHEARHTLGNARETAAWMAHNGHDSMILVTSRFHMPRSLVVFHELMPDLAIQPYPVEMDHPVVDHWWRDPDVAATAFVEYLKYLAILVWSLA